MNGVNGRSETPSANVHMYFSNSANAEAERWPLGRVLFHRFRISGYRALIVSSYEDHIQSFLILVDLQLKLQNLHVCL
ncbi:hypothetical protein DsansV1_C01g0008671 [Dioscorea sansibarensis]